MMGKEGKLVLISAVAENGVIGYQGDIPWRAIKEFAPIRKSDMGRFKDVTTGHAIITGRVNYESIPKRFRPLPDRFNVVVSKSANFRGDNLVTARTIEEALEIARGYNSEKDVYGIGGGKVYEQMINLADVLDITEIPLSPKGDTYFPEIDECVWKEVSRERQSEGHSFVTYKRRT